MLSIKVKKMDARDIKRNMSSIMRHLDMKIERGCYFAAKHVRHASDAVYTPVDTRDLVQSGGTITVNAGRPTAITYWDTDYAVSVHEDSNKVHGAAFNEKYATSISMGIEHQRKDTEKDHFALTAMFEEQSAVFSIVSDMILSNFSESAIASNLPQEMKSGV